MAMLHSFAAEFSLSKTSAMRNSVVSAENLSGTTNPISFFLFSVTFANKLFSVFAGSKRLLRIRLLRAFGIGRFINTNCIFIVDSSIFIYNHIN